MACKLISLQQAGIATEPDLDLLTTPAPIPTFDGAGTNSAKRPITDGVPTTKAASESGPEPISEPAPEPADLEPTLAPTQPTGNQSAANSAVEVAASPTENEPTSKSEPPEGLAAAVPGIDVPFRETYGDLVPRKEIDVVIVKKKAKSKLGLKLGGGADSGDFAKKYVYVLGVEGMAAETNIKKGDIVIEVNGDQSNFLAVSLKASEEALSG